MRTLLDKMLKVGIRLCMLTGVSFLVTACYGVMNPPQGYEDDYQTRQNRVEQQLQELSHQQEISQAASVNE